MPRRSNSASALRQLISCRRPLGYRHPSHSHTRRDNSRREIDGSARNAFGPALGAFDQWVKGRELKNWRNRHVDEIAMKLIEGTAVLLNERIKILEQG